MPITRSHSRPAAQPSGYPDYETDLSDLPDHLRRPGLKTDSLIAWLAHSQTFCPRASCRRAGRCLGLPESIEGRFDTPPCRQNPEGLRAWNAARDIYLDLFLEEWRKRPWLSGKGKGMNSE